jgi:hypothetical protein
MKRFKNLCEVGYITPGSSSYDLTLKIYLAPLFYNSTYFTNINNYELTILEQQLNPYPRPPRFLFILSYRLIVITFFVKNTNPIVFRLLFLLALHVAPLACYFSSCDYFPVSCSYPKLGLSFQN